MLHTLCGPSVVSSGTSQNAPAHSFVFETMAGRSSLGSRVRSRSDRDSDIFLTGVGIGLRSLRTSHVGWSPRMSQFS